MHKLYCTVLYIIVVLAGHLTTVSGKNNGGLDLAIGDVPIGRPDFIRAAFTAGLC